MKTVKTDYERFSTILICLGRQGENDVTEVHVDVGIPMKEYPNATFLIRAVQPGGKSYKAETIMNENILIWKVGEQDTEKSGKGKAQVVMRGKNGEIKKSGIATTKIAASVDLDETE